MEKNEKIEQLINELLAEYKLNVDGEISMEISKDNNTFTITIKGELKDNEFEKYLREMDDDLFQEICERFEDETGMTLNEFANHTNPSLFK